MRSPATLGVFGLAAPFLAVVAAVVPLGCIPGTGGGGGLFNLPPSVILSVDQQQGVAPLTVRFSSAGSSDDGIIIERRWDFGDGVGTSREIEPTYTYTRTGNYTVQLTLVDDRGASSSRSIVISVTERPVAIFTVDRTFAETAPAIFNFDGSASFDPDAGPNDVLQYRWDFGDGSLEFLPVTAHTFSTSGVYRVRLTVTDAVGITGFVEQVIEVGITQPALEVRVPPRTVENLVVTQNSPLWVAAEWDVEPLVPYKMSAGLDVDRDPCDAQVAVFETEGHTLVERLLGYADRVRAAAFSPDGFVLAAGGDDGVVRIHDLATGDLLRNLLHNGSPVRALAFSPDGTTLLVGHSDGSLLLRDALSDAVLQAFGGHASAVTAVAISPDGGWLFSGDAAGVGRLRTLAGTVLFTYGHPAPITSAMFSPTDPEQLLTGCEDRTARTWSTVTGALLQDFAPVINDGVLVAGHDGSVNAVAFSPDGTIVATGSSDQRIKLWNSQTAAELATYTGHTADVLALAFSPDGTRLASGSADTTARLWSVTMNQALQTLSPCVSPIVTVQYSHDGSQLLTGIAAANSILLNTVPSQGNDLILRTPQALNLANVPAAPGGTEFYLWVELSTDRSSPERRYRTDTTIRVIPSFPATIAENPPVIPLRDDAADIVLPATTTRQIFDLGPLAVGDRVFLSLLTTPGYGEAFTLAELNPTATGGGFSVLLLDADERMVAWYDSGRTLFSRQTQLIVGHNSPRNFLVIDSLGARPVPSMRVRVQRDFTDTSLPRRQYVHLNFTGASNLTIAGSTPFDLSPFAITGKTDGDMIQIRQALVQRVTTLLAPYGFDVSTDPPPVANSPRLTIYFDGQNRLLNVQIPGVTNVANLTMFGLPGYIDPRNFTLSGRAAVAASEIAAAFPALSNAELGVALGNSAAHQVGLLTGLRQTAQPVGSITDVMSNTGTAARRQVVIDPALTFTAAPLAPLTGMTAIGEQNAPQLLLELVGPN